MLYFFDLEPDDFKPIRPEIIRLQEVRPPGSRQEQAEEFGLA
ncbi:hypothetical protein JOH51_000973 [Rhizobium leguminosarum]|nr:hypothetical protein [Rhizobium leguminosarum]